MKSFLKHFLLQTAVLASCAAPFSLANSAFEEDLSGDEPQAHQHGLAKLQLISGQKQFDVQLQMPMMNLVGFEHQSKSNEEKKILKQQLEMISNIELWLQTNPQAACQLTSVKPNIDMDYDHNHDEHKHDHHEKHTEHEDFKISFSIPCSSIKDLKSIQLNLFSRLNGLEKIQAEWIHQNQQGSASLTADNPVINF